jgi:hypothetical protein
MNMHWQEVQELACGILNLGEDADADTIERALTGRYEVSFASFWAIAEKLVRPEKVSLVMALLAAGGYVKDGHFILKAGEKEASE